MSEVRIEMTGHGRGRVFVDGTEVFGVRAIRFSADADGVNMVSIELIPAVVTVSGAAIVKRPRPALAAAAADMPPAKEPAP